MLTKLVNYSPLPEPEGFTGGLDEVEQKGIERYNWFKNDGSAYAIAQATRPSTLGLVLSSNPIALLAW